MDTPKVRLEPVTVNNWKVCIALELAPHQQGFLPSNLYSIAEAQFYPEARSRAIYNNDDVLVGYALFGIDTTTQQWKIFRLMIDQAHQGKGYGESAMQALIAQIAAKPGCTQIWISYQIDNHRAQRLYAKLGFVEQSQDASGKVTAALVLNNASTRSGN